MSKQVARLGMVGCGLISHAHGRAARKSDHDISFIACTSRTMNSAQAWADEYGCEQAYDDLSDMLADREFDGIVIASWPKAHRAQILACIEAGVPAILCEKALVTSSAEAEQIWQATQQSGATVMEGFMYRHHPAIIRMEEWAGASANGPLDSIHAVFNMLDETPEDASNPGWRRQADAGGGVAHDFLCYPVDAACHFAGARPIKVQATASRSFHGTIDRLFGLITFANGVCATVESSRRASLDQHMEIRCAHRSLSVPFAWSPPGNVQIDITGSTSFLETETQTETIFPDAAHDGRLVDFPVFTRQMDNFIEVIRGEAKPRMPLRDSVVNSCVIDALLASTASGACEAVQLPDSITVD